MRQKGFSTAPLLLHRSVRSCDALSPLLCTNKQTSEAERSLVLVVATWGVVLIKRGMNNFLGRNVACVSSIEAETVNFFAAVPPPSAMYLTLDPSCVLAAQGVSLFRLDLRRREPPACFHNAYLIT